MQLHKIMHALIAQHYAPSQVTSTGEQHSPSLHDGASTVVHSLPSPQPPLSRAHEYSQYGEPVSLHTLHCEPVGHLCVEQSSIILTQVYNIHIVRISGF